MWPRTVENTSVEISCSQASSQFRTETRATRKCLDNGEWSEADLTSCTLRSDADPFLLIWFVIESNEEPRGLLMPALEGFSADGTPDTATRLAIEAEVCILKYHVMS